MKFRQLFYDSSINLKETSKRRIAFAIIVGLLSAFTIYAFFYVLREVFRVMEIGYDYVPLIISEANRNYYNLFFAALSVVFGNSIMLNFIFSRPQRITHRFNSKRKRLLNDNIFLSFNFSYWFAKIGLTFGVFSMCCMEFDFLPFFKEISILLIAVLYFESFKSLSCFFGNYKRFKYMFMHIVFLSLITFGLSRFNVVDYKSIDYMMVKNNPILEIPYSKFHSDDGFLFRHPSINVKVKEDSLGNVNCYSNDRKVSLYELSNYILLEKASVREEMIPYLKVNIQADRNASVRGVKLLERELINANVNFVSYDVVLKDSLLSRFERLGLKRRLIPQLLKIKDTSLVPQIPFPHFPLELNIRDTIIVSINNKILFNNKVIKEDSLVKIFKLNYSKQTLFLYNLNNETIYQDYITVISSHLKVIAELRKNKQKVFKQFKYDRPDGFVKEQSKLKKEFPIIIYERYIEEN